jgi:hypothetical protein
MEAMSKDNNN